VDKKGSSGFPSLVKMSSKTVSTVTSRPVWRPSNAPATGINTRKQMGIVLGAVEALA
jgi:hypothetical protein